MANDAARGAAEPAPWLFLIHQLPAKPAYFRVKIWRRLQALGAVPIKHAVYALPSNEEAREDFEWVLKEIDEAGGEAILCEARLVDGLTDQELRAQFNAARDADYEALASDLGALAEAHSAAAPAGATDAKAKLVRIKAEMARLEAIDFFGANGRDAVEGLVAALDRRLGDAAGSEATAAARTAPEGSAPLRGRVWVTRQGVHVDRIASAWLIRRFIDSEAAFKFVSAKRYQPAPGELRFDMFQAEFTHEGDRCTFEVLLARTGLADPALNAIAEIVHDIDLRDGKFCREETAGIAHLVAGICIANDDDRTRIEGGGAVFDGLYEYMRKQHR